MKDAIKDDKKTRLLDTAIDTENAIETFTEANTEELTASEDFSYYKNRIDKILYRKGCFSCQIADDSAGSESSETVVDRGHGNFLLLIFTKINRY